MNKFILLFSLCLGALSVQAAPIEDEPLPFDTKMPPRVVLEQQKGIAEPVVEQRPACKTVIKKIHGRKVRQQVCSKPATKKSTVKKGGKSKAVAHKKSSRKHKRR